jgi:hypothetical protein
MLLPAAVALPADAATLTSLSDTSSEFTASSYPTSAGPSPGLFILTNNGLFSLSLTDEGIQMIGTHRFWLSFFNLSR